MRGNYASPSELLLALRETGKSYWDLIGKPLNQNTGYNLNNPHAAEEKQYNEWYDSLKLSDEDNIKLQQLLSEYDKNVKSNTDSLPKYKKGKDKFRSFAAQMGPRIYRELHKQGIYSNNTYDNMMRQLAWESNYANSLNAINNHNYAGIRTSATKYAKYKNDDLFAQEYVSLIKRKYPNAVKAKNPVLYAKALKDNGYYEDSVEHYALSLAAMSSISNAVKAHMAANPSQYEVEVLLEDLKKQSEQPAVSTRVAKPINREPINKEPFVNTPIPTKAPLITRPEYLESNSLIKKSFELNMNNMLLGKEFLFKLPGFRGGKDSGVKEYASNDDMHINPDGSITTRNGNTGSVILPDVNVYAQKDYNSAFDYSGANEVMGTIADFTPVVGDVKQGLEAANDLRKGNYKEAAIGAGLLLLPNVLEKPLKYAGKKAFNFLSDITPKQWTAAQDAAIAKASPGHGLLDYLKNAKINAFLEGKPYYESFMGTKESFPSNWTLTKVPFSNESKEIINNSAKPRILAQAEKDIRYVYNPEIDGPDIEKYVKKELSYIEKQLDAKINEGYELGSDALFKAHDEGKTAVKTGGLQLTNNGKIVLREGEDPEKFAVHEWEHRRTNSNIGGAHYGNEKRLLRKAFTKEFRELSETVPDFKGMNMDNEMVTTVSDTREALIGKMHLRKTAPDLQNKMIDKCSDEKVFKAVEKANAYGTFYIKKMRELGKLTPELAQNIREALKHVGAYVAPTGLGLGILSNTHENESRRS